MAAGAVLSRSVCLFLVFASLGSVAAKKSACSTKDGLTVFQVLDRSDESTEGKIFADLIRHAGLVETFNDPRLNVTLFVPRGYAFGSLLPLGKGYIDIFPDVEIPRAILNFHATYPRVLPEDMKAGITLQSGLLDPKKKAINFNITEAPVGDHLKPLVVEGPVNTVNISKNLGDEIGFIACKSVIYYVDGVLLPDKKAVPSDTPKISVAVARKVAMTYSPLVTPVKPEEEGSAGK